MENRDKSVIFSAILKESFRDPIEYFQEGGIFVGRNRELSRLKAIIINRSSATVLLSGARGSGKTALVRKAVGKASGKKPSLVVDVPIIPEIDEGAGKTSERRKILLTLVRSLYFASQDNEDVKLKNTELLEDLYKRTYYSEEKETHSSASSSSQRSKDSSTRKQEIKTTYDFSPASLSAATNTIFGVSLVPLAYVISSFTNNWTRVLVGAAYVAIWLLSFVKINRTTSTTSTQDQEDALQETLSDSSDAIVDLSDNYFETYLKRFLRDNEQVKFVFVFDELDKDQGIPAETIIKCLKNLFTLTNGIYIFITAESQYHKLSNPANQSERGPDSTVFTDSIFLNQLTQQQIGEIVDVIIEKVEHQSGSDTLEKIKHYLGWTSRNVAFDLYKKIEELVDYSSSIELTVYDVSKVADDTQLNIDRDWELCASLQAYVDTVFEGHKHPWNNLYNTVLLDALHGIAHRLKEDESVTVTSDNYWAAAEAELTSERQKSNVALLTDTQKVSIGNACQDLFVGMEANDEFVFAPEVDEAAKTVVHRLNGGPFPTKSDLADLSLSLLPYEVTLSETYRTTERLISRLRKAGIGIDETTEKSMQKAKVIRNKQKFTRRKREKSTVVQETTGQLEKIRNGFNENEVIKLMELIKREVTGTSELSVTALHPTGVRLEQFDVPVATLYDSILPTTAANYFIVCSAAVNDGGIAVVTLNLTQDEKDQIKAMLRSRPNDLKTQVIDLTYGDKPEGRISSPPGLRQFRIERDYSNILTIKNSTIEAIKSRLAL